MSAINGTGNTLDNVLTGNTGNNSLTGADGNDTLDGGAGNDTLLGGAGNDVYIVDVTTDVINETVAGSAGTDTVQSSVTWTLGTNLENLTLTGSGNINGTGNTLNNVLTGNSGNNVLNASTGTDTLIGGLGNDTYIIDAATDQITENLDEGNDTVQIGVTYTLGANLENLTLTGTTAINGTGNALDNVLTGNTGANSLSGAGGNDTLNGGGGTDTLAGGTGDDTYIIGNTGVTVTESASEGMDLVQAGVTYTLGANVENLTLTGTTAINGTGNTLDNYILGNSGINTLNGTTGTDTLVGGAGNDIYVVDDVNDVVTENASEGTDTIQTGITYSLSAIANVENLTLTGTSAVNATGNDLNNTLTGNTADNILDGGLGADSLVGGTGNDTYIVDNTGDTITEALSAGTDSVQASVSYTLAANVENLTLTGTGDINATGNTLNNILTGNSGNNILNASTGTDTLVGGLGNDTYIIDAATDQITENLDEGIDAVQIGVTYTLGANLENLTLTGATAANGTGNNLDNWIIGNTAANSLSGASGNDTLDGGTGTDTLVGGAGDDLYIVDATTDVVTESNALDGTDTVNSSVNFTLGANLENLTLTGTGAINGTGNSLDNILTGNTGNNILDGGAGIDTLTGGDGNDTYIVDHASDVVNEDLNKGIDVVQTSLSYTLGANVENLTLTGNNDVNATGNALDNRLAGNTANNVLDGGDGNDTYVFSPGSGQDVITDSSGTDTLDFSAYTAGIQVNLSNIETTSLFNTQKSLLDLNSSADGSTSITDLYGNAWTAAGNANIQSANSWASGEKYMALDGTGDSFSSTTLIPNGSNYTIHWRQSFNNLTSQQSMLSTRASYGLLLRMANNQLTLWVSSNNTAWNVANAVTATKTDWNANEWYDFEVSYSSTGGYKVFVDGQLAISIASTASTTGNTGIILGTYANANYSNGAIADVYFTNTETLHSSSFTPSSQSAAELYADNVSWSSGEIENIVGGSGNDTLTGNSANNSLTGGAGIDTLNGGVGADTMAGGLGNDTYLVDDLGDVIQENLSEGTDTVQTSLSWTLGANIENLVLQGSANVTGTGNALANSLTGNSGNNTLDGGTGIDTLIGGLGDDVYYVDNASDITTEAASQGLDSVYASVTYTLSSTQEVENLYLTGTSAINGTGNTLNNYIQGNSGANSLTGGSGHDTLEGGTGNDTLVGGAGNDVYIVDIATDVINETVTGSAGTDTVQSSVTWTLGTGLENLTLMGSGAINATGNTVNNILTGNTGDNVLNGGTGVDTLIGGLGNDTYVVDSTTDTITENTGEGTDLVQSSVTYTLGSYLENLTITATTAVNGTGNALDNLLTGGSGNNSLSGGGGHDTLNGAAGIDSLLGGLGNDTYIVDSTTDVITENTGEGTDTVQSSVTFTLSSTQELENLTLTGTSVLNGTGNSLNNYLTGNTGVNTLTGNAGNDTLDGATGNDSLVGGAGNDVYIFRKGDGQDTVNDSGDTDSLLFDSSVSQSNVAIFKTVSGDLKIGYTDSSGDLITIQGQGTTATAIEHFELSNGYYMTDANINQIISDMAAYASTNSVSFTSLDDVKNDAGLMAIVNGGWHT